MSQATDPQEEVHRPAPIRKYDQWIVWKNVERRDDPSKTTKILYTPVLPPQRLEAASSTDRSTWASYKDAKAVFDARDDVDGVGFVFSEDDPFCGIDLDAAFDASGEWHPWAAKIVGPLNSYTERSPSGTGAHVIARASLPGRGRKKGSHDTGEIGIYDRDRFFTFTGDRVFGPKEPRDCQRQVAKLYTTLFPERETPEPTDYPAPGELPGASLTDEDILDKLQAEPNGKARALLAGDTTGYPSTSEADEALCLKIAFYTGPDPERIEDIFSLSALGRRGKWLDRDKYRRDTINFALQKINKFWTPPKTRKPRPSARVEERTSTVPPDPITLPAMPFPVDALPATCSQLIQEGVDSLGCDPALLGLPILSALSGAVGTSRVARIKRDWKQFPALFLCVVADTGDMKTPAADIALAPVYDLQKRLKTQYQTKKASYDEDVRKWEVEKKLAAKKDQPAPAPPDPPTFRRIVASDTTIEALMGNLEKNPKGMNIHVDELVGWVRGMDQYKSGGKGAERQHWLSVWNSSPMIVDRKSRLDEPIMISQPFISLFGGIQPQRLHELGGTMEDGLADRFLYAMPESRYILYSDKEIEKTTENRYAALYEELANLGAPVEYGEVSPKPLEFTFDAKRLFRDQVNLLAAEAIAPGFPTRLKGIWSKFRGYISRLALVLSCARWAELKPSVRKQTTEEITREDMENAISLLEFFKAHAKRVFGVLQEVDPQEIFGADLKDFLEAQEGRMWRSSPTDMLEALDAAGVAHLPSDPSLLTRQIKELAKRTPILHTDTGKEGPKGHQTRYLKVWLDATPANPQHSDETPESTVGTVIPVLPKDPPPGEQGMTGSTGITGSTGSTEIREEGAITSKEPILPEKEPSPVFEEENTPVLPVGSVLPVLPKDSPPSEQCPHGDKYDCPFCND